MKKLLYLVIFIFLNSCKDIAMDKQYSINLKNNSKSFIHYWINYNYPDTNLANSNNNVYVINPEQNENIVKSRHKWEDCFRDYFPSDTLLIYYFDSDTINKYNWDEIRINHKVLRKNIYSYSDLYKSNWTITYP